MNISDLQGAWTGTNELWLEPGTPVRTSDATVRIEGTRVHYTWSFEGKPQQGELVLTDEAATWQDSWHQPGGVALEPMKRWGARFRGGYSYPAGDGSPDWHWTMSLLQRPDGSLVITMTNVTPWGEEAPAVRLVAQR